MSAEGDLPVMDGRGVKKAPRRPPRPSGRAWRRWGCQRDRPV